MKRPPLKSAIILVLCLFAVSCANINVKPQEMTFTEKAYSILHTSKSGYEVTMVSVSELQMEGFIRPEQREKINKYAGRYVEAHNTAVMALDSYMKINDAEREARVVVALGEVQKLFTEFVKYVNPILKEKYRESTDSINRTESN